MNKVNTEGYLYASILFLMMSFVCLYFLASEIPYVHEILLDWNQYYGILAVTPLYISSFIVVSRRNRILEKSVAVPSVLFLAFIGYYTYLGTIDHYSQVASGAQYIYLESITETYNYISISLACWIIGYLVGSHYQIFSSYTTTNNQYKLAVNSKIWGEKRLKIFVISMGVVGIIAFAVFIVFFVQGLPVLQGVSPNASSDLRNKVMNEAGNIHSIAFNLMTMALLYSALYISLYKRSMLVLIIFLLTTLAFLSWGARIYYVIPFLIIFPYFVLLRKYNIKKVLTIFLIVFIAGSVYGLIRNVTFYATVGQNFSDRSHIERLSDLHVSPEFRDTLGVVSHLDQLQREYGPVPYFKGIFYTALPGKLLSVFGINKNELFDEDGIGSGWLIARITRGYDWTGVRSGIMGQTLMAFGVTGVIVLFFLYGVLFSQLDRYSKTINVFSPNMFLIYILSGLFSFSIIGTTHSVFSKFWYFLYTYILIYLATTIKHRKKKEYYSKIIDGSARRS